MKDSSCHMERTTKPYAASNEENANMPTTNDATATHESLRGGERLGLRFRGDGERPRGDGLRRRGESLKASIQSQECPQRITWIRVTKQMKLPSTAIVWTAAITGRAAPSTSTIEPHAALTGEVTNLSALVTLHLIATAAGRSGSPRSTRHLHTPTLLACGKQQSRMTFACGHSLSLRGRQDLTVKRANGVHSIPAVIELNESKSRWLPRHPDAGKKTDNPSVDKLRPVLIDEVVPQAACSTSSGRQKP